MKLLTLLAAMGLSLPALAQDIPSGEVPAAVMKTFKTSFPAATGLEWERKIVGYEAEFKVDHREHKALLDSAGNLLRYKQELPASALPVAVKNTVSQQYKGFRISDAAQVTRNQKVWYQLELDGEPHDQKVVLSKEGKVDNTLGYW
ncbi:PepSY-like domain-containing protein [Chitinophaga nivalis]|uniref:PepSY-like domain-containing protein n=1 Tax=Chitinophaga nivalis TaxID=2991709 RepID=A0ABT3INN8_9BACT|nr:PepSY-like domain-containing protein [Chitinophaga nivalis]MCW3464798.1 PepSY-like domain-containing protein [Chitinophaga nivalis]MCW3485511.1 PepSY-like domain-containing protein [Chitinophaga nivalis]